MAFDVINVPINSPVTNGSTITFDYPAGRSASDYAASGHTCIASSSTRPITPTFAGGNISFTWSGSTLLAGLILPVQLILAESSGGSGGNGGPFTLANGAGVPIGSTLDEPYAIGDEAGTLVAVGKAAAEHLERAALTPDAYNNLRTRLYDGENPLEFVDVVDIKQVGLALEASDFTPVSQVFTADSVAVTFTPIAGRPINLEIRGTFVGTVKIQRRLDGVNWTDITLGGAAYGSYTAAMSEPFWVEYEHGVLYRLNVDWTSGSINVWVSQ